MQDTCLFKSSLQISHPEHNENYEMHLSSKVHVNPNFRNGKNLVIHVNPKMHQSRKIHVNPKIMQNIGPESIQEPLKIERLQQNDETNLSNERLLTETDKNIKNSIHVNPKLMAKFRCPSVQLPGTLSPVPLTTDCKKLNQPNVVQKGLSPVSGKMPRPRLMALSRRKLVLMDTPAKKAVLRTPDSYKKFIRRTSLVRVNIKKSKASGNLTKYVPMKNKYKIDKTTTSQGKAKKNCVPTTSIRWDIVIHLRGTIKAVKFQFFFTRETSFYHFVAMN